ncbi:MAG: YafY family transcriptional regulator [Lysobacterales bacterium]|nr:MAG: YafY family transcriptional regulator [Xanthomonadales bacterium]
MSRSTRMFEIIQLLRSTDAPLTAQAIASRLEVTKRTVYRDIAALQAIRVPIEGEAGVGYVMRPGFDLPPLMFTGEEVEAIVVGLAMLGRTGDTGLQSAAVSAGQKIGTVLPGDGRHDLKDWPLYASSWHAVPRSHVDMRYLRRAIREEEKVLLTYSDLEDKCTCRTVMPLALVYYIEAVVLAAWCELRSDFRHFRVDRIIDCEPTSTHFAGQSETLRARWREQHQLP